MCQRTKLQGHRAVAMAEPVPRAEHFGDLITADHKVLCGNCESRNNHRYAIVMQELATQWTNRIRHNRLLKKHSEACEAWSPFLWNSAKSVKIFPEIVVREHHTDQKQMGLLKEQCAEWKKVRLCCFVAIRSEWKLVGRFHGVLHLSAKRQRSLLRPMKNILGNHVKDRSFHFVHCLRITL